MKIVVRLLFAFNFLLLTSQNKRIVYEYSYTNDSTKLDQKKSEILYLDLHGKESYFYNSKFNYVDSLKQQKNIDNYKLLTLIREYYSSNSYKELLVRNKNAVLSLYYKSDSEYYRIDLGNTNKWNILPEKITYNGYNLQKAYAVINDRNWTVWFSDEVPINNGPFIFQDLPGLVFIAEDKNKSQVFKLVEIKTLEDDHSKDALLRSTEKSKSITMDQFSKMLVDQEVKYLNVASNHSTNTPSEYFDSSGNSISEQEYMLMQRKSREEVLKRNNNKLINDFRNK
ncbi:GLPGLI family protein [Chryseobacterium wangxinyae]|uniref:GLPGLI family protein n=1 Tax=Chryseobacterium sp. CY353 TaxID=2997334 RepID=UPI00226ECEC1|nr:GLPGLI family protein [Chryseobacterium sp. CY353]MCY0970937.1 GLPGLI family protein [Chryseobacterium sp. CY353]